MSEQALKITNTVARLQKEMKCGICCSTFKDPILSTCYHIFCRSCMDACFERKRKVQCPICRTVLDKRSCRDSYQITMAVQNYLKLSEAFKQDIENLNTFRTLPPEKAFLESQMPLDVTIIPENDGKRCAPDFAIPLLPVRRKRTSRPSDEPTTSTAAPPPPNTDFHVFAVPKLIEKPAQKSENPPVNVGKQSKKAVNPAKIDAETSTNPLKIQTFDLRNVDIQEHIDVISQYGQTVDEIDALFQLMPSMRPFLEKNANLLLHKLDMPTVIFPPSPPAKKTRKSLEKQEKRVSFANSQELEQHRYPDPSVSSEALEVVPQEEKDVKKVKNPARSTGNDEDEVVEDSEGEGDVENEGKGDEPMELGDENQENTTVEPADRTLVAVQTEAERIDEELSRVPKTIVCSRIHNDEDEVELLSDFYHKFLSNACRFSEEVNSHTTHLVMMNSEGRTIPQKSTAYLQAIARKCIIVGRQWMVDCVTMGMLLAEADYTITTCTSAISAEIESNSEIGWLRSRNDAHGKLFQGCRFMILRKFTMNPYFDYKQLIDLVQLCGGEILSSYENQPPENLYIIFSKHSKALEESRRMEQVYKCAVVRMEWVLDSISEYTILPTDAYRAVDSIEQHHQ
ncbi:unnamed protein product [Caenorhabditis brenneri]